MGQGPKTPQKQVYRLLLMELHRQSRDLVYLGGAGPHVALNESAYPPATTTKS